MKNVTELNPTHQPLTILGPEPARSAITPPPLFDLVEQEDYYLLSVDLPSIHETGSAIEVGRGEIRITHDKPQDPALSSLLFRFRSGGGQGVRAVYYEGALWLLLPKKGHKTRLRSVQELLSAG